MDLDSSPVENAAADVVDTQVSDATPAESSTAEAGSMLDAVKTALAPKEASPASEEPGEKAEAESDGSKAQSEENEELSAEELKALSQKAQGRFKRLTERLKAKDGEIVNLKSKADEFDKIDKFISQAGLTNQDVGQALQISALIVSDKPKALEVLRGYVTALENAVGEVLPADLQEQVRLGYLTEAHARELSRSKARERETAQRMQQTQEAQRRDAEQREQQTLVNSTIQAVETWEKAKAEKDPDWHLKRKDVAEKVELAIARESRNRGAQYFPNASEVVKLSEDALKEVNASPRFRSPPKSPVTPITGNASTRSTPAPKTMLDVVRQTVAVR